VTDWECDHPYDVSQHGATSLKYWVPIADTLTRTCCNCRWWAYVQREPGEVSRFEDFCCKQGPPTAYFANVGMTGAAWPMTAFYDW
jgi:hypothetical protein